MRVRSGLTVAIACLGIAAACSSPTVPPPSSSTDLLTAPPASTGPTDSAAGPTATPSAPPVTAPPPTPVQSTADAPPCSPPDVAVDVSGQGAGGSILLVIDVTNDGTAACGLNGPPASISLRAGGGSMPLTYQPRPDPWPGDTPGIIAPPVVLQPGGTGRAKAVWRNWCLGPAAVSTVWVGLGAEAIDAHPEPPLAAARCDNEHAQSTVEGFPFTAGTTE